MKHLIIAGVLAVSASAVSAQPFEFQRQIGSTEYNLTEDTENMRFAAVSRSHRVSSLTEWMLSANVDGVALNDYRGTVEKSGPSQISLYEIQRDSPEGIAYRDYHERYAPDTDWDAIAREYRTQRTVEGLASGAALDKGNS